MYCYVSSFNIFFHIDICLRYVIWPTVLQTYTVDTVSKGGKWQKAYGAKFLTYDGNNSIEIKYKFWKKKKEKKNQPQSLSPFHSPHTHTHKHTLPLLPPIYIVISISSMKFKAFLINQVPYSSRTSSMLVWLEAAKRAWRPLKGIGRRKGANYSGHQPSAS